jgi:KDO2-lipid IV(A) lauroyltransferase
MARIPNPINRYFYHPLQAITAVIFFTLFRIFPIDLASAIGGYISRTIGPYLKISRRATNNLKLAFPEKSEVEITTIVRGMWDNLGRLAGEYPHLGKFVVNDDDLRVEYVGGEHIDLLKKNGNPAIFFSGHLGNWELLSLGAIKNGISVDRVYREANNRLVEWLYRSGRGAVKGALIPKGSTGARALLKSLKNGRHLFMLIDQKMNDGISVPFFGRDVMTAPAMAELALRYDCPLIPTRITRLVGARFKLTIFPPLKLIRTDSHKADVIANMSQVNALIEKWVRDKPEQWLWLHNRWPDN